MRQGKAVALASLGDLPGEAARDKAIFSRTDTKSTLIIPLMMGGLVIGAATFAITRAERAWPEPLIERFQTVARVFAAALARSRAEREYHAGVAAPRGGFCGGKWGRNPISVSRALPPV